MQAKSSPEEVRRQTLNGLDRLLTHTLVLSREDQAMLRAHRGFWLTAAQPTLQALGDLVDRERSHAEG